MNVEPNWSDELWPYNASQLDQIRNCLQVNQQGCISKIVMAARVFAALKTGRSKKPNPGDELAIVKARAVDLYAALSRLSQEAEAHLLAKWQEANGKIQDEPVHREALLRTLHRFIHENQKGFNSPAPLPSRGPVVQKDEAQLVRRLEQAFIAGHDGKFRTRGWPKFVRLCWDPMVAVHLVNELSERSLQRKLTDARQYFGSVHRK